MIKATYHKTTYQILKEQREIKKLESKAERRARRKMTLEFLGMGVIMVVFMVSFVLGFWELHYFIH